MDIETYELKKSKLKDDAIVLFGLLLGMVPITLLQSFVLVKLWVWFIVPVFGLPILTIVPAIGLRLIVGYLTFHNIYSKDTRSGGEKLYNYLSMGTFYPLLVLLSGYIVHCL